MYSVTGLKIRLKEMNNISLHINFSTAVRTSNPTNHILLLELPGRFSEIRAFNLHVYIVVLVLRKHN
jgi:hypothetical protein